MNKQEIPDVKLERMISAPRERVWRALVDPKDIIHWQHAGDGWWTPFAETDVKVGGAFRIGYAGPDSKESDFVIEGTYLEIVEPEKLVYSIGDGRLVTVLLEDDGNKTKLMLSFTPETENSIELQEKGWGEIYDHFVEHLEK